MASNYNNNNIHNNNLSKPFKGVRSRSPDPYHSPHKRNHSRRHTLPLRFHYNPNFSHPYFSQHTHHLCNNLTADDSIDTSSLDQGILFYQDPNNGETNFYWEDELETCSPSLMPENTDNLMFDNISGDSSDIEEKYFRILANELNNRKEDENQIDLNQLGESPGKIFKPTDDMMIVDVDPDVALPLEDFIVPPKEEEEEFDLEDMVKEMNELLSDKNQELDDDDYDDDDDEREEPPSPLSPRDPERDGPVLSEQEENTEDGIYYRFEHDPKFQDEAGLDDDEEGQISDDEGMDPMENH